MNELRFHVSKDQAYRAKRQALKKLEGSPEYQYTKLWDYVEEVRKTNIGSTVILGIEEENGEVRFNRFYMCFKALKEGFLAGCRPIIGVDGCHLKGPYDGVLLTAVGVDPNNNTYPIAYAIVRSENMETWEWFLTILKQDLNIIRDYEYTFMSDKQKGHNVKACPEKAPTPGLEDIPENVQQVSVGTQLSAPPLIKPPARLIDEPEETEDVTNAAEIPNEQLQVLTMLGPSMYNQLQMSQPPMPPQSQSTLHTRLNIRTPPPMTGTLYMPSFSYKPARIVEASKSIIQEGGQKYVEISK
ncbi:UNVERIFIED_CONTAM: hypothetical protein Slati_3437400 [Sesamum latifolium]|uniref:MULE transposase domain-containing protein n=1 Tax=Sesamum latifolium TaxID=2727402 RepID=A0AAW2UIJ8_9LAMI